MTTTSLVDDVQRRLAEIAAENSAAGSALAEAERMSNQFGDIQPDPFYLPLDALAGFTSSESTDPWTQEPQTPFY